MLRQIKDAHSKVETILRLHPEARDDDKLLWLAYMQTYGPLKTIHENHRQAVSWFRSVIMSRETPKFETLRRARQKVQETTPELRGKNYKGRKKEAEKVRGHFSGKGSQPWWTD